jgi:hypothetical protein
MTSRRRKSATLATQSAELALAVPQVVAHRLTRMAMSGPKPSLRDQKEFTRMVTEKMTAFGESWTAMTLQAMQAQQSFALSWLQSLWTPPFLPKSSARATSQRLHGAALGVLGKGLAPVHRKAVANAKRLARTRLK